MKITRRTAPLTVIAALILGGTSAPNLVHAQTPEQMRQLEYERQQREYWRAQERQRQEELLRQQQQENTRRQQEESRRGYQQMIPKGDIASPQTGGGAPSAGRSAPQASAGDALQVCKSNPLPKGERNPLLGRWRPKDTPKGDAMSQLLQTFANPQCASFALGLEFRERELLTAVAPAPAYYGRKGDDLFVCLPQSSTRLLRFRVEGPNSLIDVATKCRLVRDG